MYKIKNFLNKRNSFLVVMTLTIFLVCIVNASYAFFTATAERKGALNIVSGNLYSLISSGDLNDNKQITINGNSTKTIDVKLTNANGIDAKFNFYYITNASDVEIGYTKAGDDCPSSEGIVLPKNGDKGDSKSYVIQIKNNSASDATITFGSKAGLSNLALEFPSDGHVISPVVCNNTSEETIKGLPYNSCEDVDYNNESANKNAMFIVRHKGEEKDVIDYRYIGDNPNNYVQIDGESSKWRIIGVFDDPVADGETSGKKIKLIRDEILPDNYSWDNTTETNYGSNNWNSATLQKILNSGPYWNKENGTCASGTTLGATKSCDFSTTGLSSTLKEMIANMKWYLGAGPWLENRSTEAFYTLERGTTQAGASDSTTTWNGKVALMYPSDYGYTYANGVSTACYNTLANGSGNKCNQTEAAKGWLANTSKHQWTLAPYSADANYVFYVSTNGYVNNNNAWLEYEVRPVVYLKSDISITGGSGTQDSPYIIS